MDTPPLFKQGASARVRAGFFALVSIAMLVVDSHMHSLGAIRQVVGSVLYPVQSAALVPRDAAVDIAGYFSTVSTLRRDNTQLRAQQIVNAQTLQQYRQLAAENLQLRNLLNMQQRIDTRSLVGEILYDARDPFTRKIVLNRGSRDGVEAGQPVIDDVGVVGQVTRIFPFSSEVTLLTDKDQAIPVQVLRNGLRSIAYGRGQAGSLDLRFMAANADIRKGDVLVTSGIDGLYPAGLSVATVSQVEVKSADAFARILCTPAAGIDRHRQLLVLLVPQNLAPRAADDGVATDKSAKLFPRRLKDSGTDKLSINEDAPGAPPAAAAGNTAGATAGNAPGNSAPAAAGSSTGAKAAPASAPAAATGAAKPVKPAAVGARAVPPAAAKPSASASPPVATGERAVPAATPSTGAAR